MAKLLLTTNRNIPKRIQRRNTPPSNLFECGNLTTFLLSVRKNLVNLLGNVNVSQ
jgi:hypothetical protein